METTRVARVSDAEYKRRRAAYIAAHDRRLQLARWLADAVIDERTPDPGHVEMYRAAIGDLDAAVVALRSATESRS